MELTDKEIKRQDFVDNEIQQLLEKLNPTNQFIDWNIENISKIREVIKNLLVEKLNLCNEQNFYPFIKD